MAHSPVYAQAVVRDTASLANEMFLFKQENGDWKIHRYLFASSQAPH